MRDHQPDAPARYRLLQTLRLYATEQLREAGREHEARCAHVRYYLRLVRAAGPHLRGSDEEHRLARLGAAEPDLQAALHWAATHDPALAPDLAAACRRVPGMTWQERWNGYPGGMFALTWKTFWGS